MLIILTAAPAMAQEAGNLPADTTAGWIFRWLNFAIVLGLIIWVMAKVAAPHLRQTRDEISRKIAEGARAREAAEQQEREARAKLAGIGTEIAGMQEAAKRGAEAETARLRATSREEAEKIERMAQAEIAAAERAARVELKAEAGRLAVERAEALLREQLTPKTEEALFHTFVEELERTAN